MKGFTINPGKAARRMQIDRIDRHILTLLAADARMAVSTVAGTVGLSQSAATRRIQALEAAGMIEGYAARLGARRLGFAVTALVAITLGTQIEEELARFEAAVGAITGEDDCGL